MSQQNPKNTKQRDISRFALILLAILLFNIVASFYFVRIDLTSDKRYTLSDVSRKLIKNLDDIVYVRVYLDGEMPVAMKKFQRSIYEMLGELENYSKNGNLQYEFRNPAEGSDAEREAIYKELISNNLYPFTVQETDAEGGSTQRSLFPGAIINYKGEELVINFVQNNPRYSPEENLNFARQNLEYNIISAIEQISRKNKPRIAFVEGHGELEDIQLLDIMNELSSYYKVGRVKLDGHIGRLDDYKVVVVAKPTTKWSEDDKLVIDQYIMNGGRVAWFIDAVIVNEDSLARGENTIGAICDHNLNDQLFRYGVRVNANVIEDWQCVMRPVNVAPEGMPANFRPKPWMYFPLLIPPDNNKITSGLNLIMSQYPGVIDTVGSGKVKKSFILYSSENAKVINAPLFISLSQVDKKVTKSEFNRSFLPVAVSLEGVFNSPFRNRMVSQYNNHVNFDFKTQSKETKMIIVSDGDIIRNDVNMGTKVPYPLGFDRYMGQAFGNKEFVKNIINYLADENNLMDIRKHDFTLRLLDKSKTTYYRTQIILINTVLPLLLVIIAGILFIWRRKRKYSQ